MDLNQIDKIVQEVIRETINNNGLGAAWADNGLGTARAAYDEKLAAAMEHSMIRPDATPAMVKQFCEEAVKYRFRNVSLAPCFVAMAAKQLKGTGVGVSTAVCFPMGIASTETKVFETNEVINNGASEIDLPINIGLVKAGEFREIREEIEAVVKASAKRALIKVVVDLGQLTEEEQIKVAVTAQVAGADFLKIAATTRPTGVNDADIKFFRQIIGPGMGLKADGGIKDRKTSLSIIEAGGTTIGASGSVKIVTG